MKDSPAFFFKPPANDLWDTWVYYHDGKFYLYYLNKTPGLLGGVGLAISHDGVHWKHHGGVIEKASDAVWLGSGAVWPATSKDGKERFIMNFSEWRDEAGQGRNTIFLAESLDLVHWTRLGPEYSLHQDARWYEPNGRWDGVWPVRRPDGGYYGYWTATPKENRVGSGFGESIDGISWSALEAPALTDVPAGPLPLAQSPEISAAYFFGGQYYVLAGLDDLIPQVNAEFTDFRPGHTTFISSLPGGPFLPAPRNRRLLVGNAAYFLRFVDTPDGVLANHHSWEILQGRPMNVDDSRTYMTPLKRAEWDEKGTLRLKWWEGNEKAKGQRIPLGAQLLDTAFLPAETLILEGKIALSSSTTGVYLQGSGDKGTGFLVRANGLVEYGDINPDGSGFEKKGYVDRELALGDRLHFRLIRNRRITEFYLEDYLMQCYCLPEEGTGRIGLIGSAERFGKLAAWYCA